MAGDLGSYVPGHNAALPPDVNNDLAVSSLDALLVINELNRSGSGEATDSSTTTRAPADNVFVDVSGNGAVEPLDALLVINDINASVVAAFDAQIDIQNLGSPFKASFNNAEAAGAQNLLTELDVQTLLNRASMASPSNDAIIAIVDRAGKILGVRVEEGVDAGLKADNAKRAFAIDGAVAKARTAAFFANNAAPLTSRTIRNISQSTITQREVEASPNNPDERYRGPGFVAPIGVGGHFPPEIANTPQVDLFAIEHQSRDSQFNAGLDGIKGNGDDFELTQRFNVDPAQIAMNAETFLGMWPESYGVQTQLDKNGQSRGIATLPGGIPLYKLITGLAPGVTTDSPLNLVGGIGVFFPGKDGFATHEQGFVHASDRGGVAQTEKERTNADRVLEAEFIALAAAVGDVGFVGPSAFVRNFSEFDDKLPPLPNFGMPIGRIDLVGLTLEIFGPLPTQAFPYPGLDRLIAKGRSLNGPGVSSGIDVQVTPDANVKYLAGTAVPEGWLVKPHDSKNGGLTAAQVQQIIEKGVASADQVRAAIRLDIPGGFRPGARTRMVLAVADTNGDILGLFRMKDATIFSIDVAVAKSRNTAYYADANDLQEADIIDFNGILPDNKEVSQSFAQYGNTVPKGTALTNRTFRFLAEPRYPTGASAPSPAPQSILILTGINKANAENTENKNPLPASVYADANSRSVLAFTAFNPSRNFRDPGDLEVVTIDAAGVKTPQPLANQNGVVFFPGSSPLYVAQTLQGGFGVSGDGVDQDDVVTASGQVGFEAPANLRVDQYIVGGVRLPYQKYNRNPLGA